MGEMTTARGTEPESKAGSLSDANSRDNVDELVSDAATSDARAVLGGARAEGPGYFYPPTILTGVTEGTRILSEEIFGPAAPIITFSTPRTKRSAWPTTPNTGGWRTSSPATSSAVSGWVNGLRPACPA
jgi:acyl-CoA reductase-like NAD-dependent aldehyde dehydrogenase